MRNSIKKYKVAIIVCCTIMAILFVFFLKRNSVEDEIIPWIPDPKPLEIVKDTVMLEEDELPMEEAYNLSQPSGEEVSKKETVCCELDTHTHTSSWEDEFSLDSVELTIIVPGVEVGIKQKAK